MSGARERPLVSFVNSAFVRCPEGLLLKGGWARSLSLRVRYGVIRHPHLGPIIIDGGYSDLIYRVPKPSALLRAYRALLRPQIIPKGDPWAALPYLGCQVEDVRHVVLTHLHPDHLGYLSLFPDAVIHVAGAALDLLRRSGVSAPNHARRLARHGVFAELLPVDLLSRARRIENSATVALPGHASSFDLFGDGSVVARPLPGHARGHVGLYFPTLERPLLYAADTAWTRIGLLEARERALPVWLVADDMGAARRSSEAVRRLVQETEAELVLCHDPAVTSFDLGEAG